MSDDQRPGRPGSQEEPKDEVEAHGHHGHKFGANAEATDEVEAEDGDEVEAHRHINKLADKLD